MTTVLLAVLLVGGIALVVRALVPRRLPADQAVLALTGHPAHPDRQARNGAKARVSDTLTVMLSSVLGTPRVQAWLTPLRPDLAITEQTTEQFVGSLLRRSAVLVVVLILWSSDLASLVPSHPAVGVVVGTVALAVLWARQLARLRALAERRRRTMTGAVQGLMTITMVGATTATPIQEVAERALDHGHGWAFEMLRSAFQQGTAGNLRIYESLGELADQIGSRSLRLYADTIRTGDHAALALTTIAQRSKALQNEVTVDVTREAEQHAKTLQLPIAVFAIVVVLITVGAPLYYGF